MKTLLLALSVLLSLPAFASESIFRQSRTTLERSGGYACEATGVGNVIQDLSRFCGTSVGTWKNVSASILGPLGSPVSRSRELALRQVVLRNTVITEAYAALYLRSQTSFPACGRSLLPWVGGASLGSLKSGQVMRSGLSVNQRGIKEFDQVKDGNYRPRFRMAFGPVLDRIALESATLALGEGNQAIFMDLYWQLLAGATCGADTVVSTIERDANWRTDAKLLRARKIWLLLSEASRTCEPGLVVRANQGFVEIEQYLVGQGVMYNGLIKSLGGWALSPLVEAALPGALGSFPNFLEHALKTTPRLQVSFANADQRVRWMKDQLGVMEANFSAKPDLLKPMFCSAVRDSFETRKTLRARAR